MRHILSHYEVTVLTYRCKHALFMLSVTNESALHGLPAQVNSFPRVSMPFVSQMWLHCTQMMSFWAAVLVPTAEATQIESKPRTSVSTPRPTDEADMTASNVVPHLITHTIKADDVHQETSVGFFC